MKFFIDGDGVVSQLTAMTLLTDIARPYPDCVFVTVLKDENVEPSVADKVTYMFSNAGYRSNSFTSDVLEELSSDDEKIFIVVDANTRPDLVGYCLDHGIQVLDLVLGLFPVK